MDLMTESLPITIEASALVEQHFDKIAAVNNKLEAQLNFHTMTANWYGDEQEVLQISLFVVMHDELHNVMSEQSVAPADDVSITSLSDKCIRCDIAITPSECDLLSAQPKLLSGYLLKKLSKVLNLIAKQQNLTAI